MVDLFSWAGMVLVIGAVWCWSKGHTRMGNWICIASTLPWNAVGFMTDNYALIAMQIVLGGKAAYELGRKDYYEKSVHRRFPT